jgi:hypothetical protein
MLLLTPADGVAQAARAVGDDALRRKIPFSRAPAAVCAVVACATAALPVCEKLGARPFQLMISSMACSRRSGVQPLRRPPRACTGR